ncbi:hypothetical protein GUJ93_ZPchr0002g24870 [Zizania palustris]|uniref:Uncharacterized protein n=1 Tax=Zizania palustris TaxID=103762 RepID=A0A8J5VWP3_ZIZPA|nr:hypothetical protein GUJ93_ZPchr0002g24870 [Zizania palustris]
MKYPSVHLLHRPLGPGVRIRTGLSSFHLCLVSDSTRRPGARPADSFLLAADRAVNPAAVGAGGEPRKEPSIWQKYS